MTKQYKYSFKVFTSNQDLIEVLLDNCAEYLMKGEATFSTNRECGILINQELTEEVTSARERNKLMKQYQKNTKESKNATK